MNNWMYIAGGGAVVAFFIFLFRKKIKAESNLSTGKISENPALVEAVKRIYKLETANYTSNIFKKTNGAGMIAFSSEFPYGWLMLKEFWNRRPDLAPVGMYASSNGNKYLKFPSVFAGQKAVANVLQVRLSQGKNAGAYNSLNPSQAAEYLRRLLSVSLPETEIVENNEFLT